MRNPFTTLLLIVLTLSLPLRAVAGFAMFDHASVPPAAEKLAAAHAMPHAMQEMPCCHEGQLASSSSDHSHCSHEGTDGKHAATACAHAECCVGVLMLPFIPQAVLHHEPASSPIAFLERPYAGFLPEGLERPPRTSQS